jgi:hypothetical protein
MLDIFVVYRYFKPAAKPMETMYIFNVVHSADSLYIIIATSSIVDEDPSSQRAVVDNANNSHGLHDQLPQLDASVITN